MRNQDENRVLIDLAERVRAACAAAAAEAYEDAGLRGLCLEGRWEHALGAIRSVDLRQVIQPAVEESRGPVRPIALSHGGGRLPRFAASTAGGASRRDLEDGDLHGLLTTFYDRLAEDPQLARYFAELDMARHIPRISDFWSTILFGTRRYSGNAFAPHRMLEGLTPEHFASWVAHLEATVDADYAGPIAELMKANAHRIAYTMQLRLGIPPFEPYEPERRRIG